MRDAPAGPATLIEIENLAAEVSAVPMEDIADFLRDPIGYGTYDWSDQITLDEFEVAHPFHGAYVSVLT